MQLRILKTTSDFYEAIQSLNELSKQDNKTEEQLNFMAVLSLLVDDYQHRNGGDVEFPIDPIDAIEFRLDQLGQKHKYLRQFIGSPSKVSEVMNRKIGLSLSMIRSLHEGLGIPAEILLQDPRRQLGPQVPVKDFPFNEMFKRGYFSFTGTLTAAQKIAEELLEAFFEPLPQKQIIIPCFRKNNGIKTNTNALKAWQCRIINRLNAERVPRYERQLIPKTFFQDIAVQSQYQYGPQNAKEILNKAGIHLIYEPQLPNTRLDGAAFMLPDGHPVIALTLRLDRLDNYWFTLMHELHHVMNDLPQNNNSVFMDETDLQTAEETLEETNTHLIEIEENADKAARDALIPVDVWRAIGRSLCCVQDSKVIQYAAAQRKLSPAVLAGRIRWETKNYNLFQDLLGKCRKQLMPQKRPPSLHNKTGKLT